MTARRARELAERHPEAAEVLLLVAEAEERTAALRPAFPETQALALRLQNELSGMAPEPLRAAVPDTAAYFQNPDAADPGSFWARLALAAWARHAPLTETAGDPAQCPYCSHPPQAGVLRAEGQGEALSLVCSLCRREWPYRRLTCPGCGETDAEKLEFHDSPAFPAARIQSCRTCSGYLHLLLVERDPALVPWVDELALLPLDAWAANQGLAKVWPNLAGL